MKKNKLLLILLILSLITTLGIASAYYLTVVSIKNNFDTIDYFFSVNANGGINNSTSLNFIDGKVTLPMPNKEGYTFLGYSDSKNGVVKYGTNNIDVLDINKKELYAIYSTNSYTITYNLDGGSISGQKAVYNAEETFTLPTPVRTGYIFNGWTGTGLSSVTKNVIVNKGSTGNRTYTANWIKYNTAENNGIYLISTRDNITWTGKLDGYYKPGDNNVNSGNWTVSVENYCVHIKGKTYPKKAYTYQFYIYKANNISELIAVGNASVPGNYLGKASTTICW